MTGPLETKVALVTGSSTGIGAAVARALASAGAFVVVNSRSSVTEGEGVATEIGGSYRRADVSIRAYPQPGRRHLRRARPPGHPRQQRRHDQGHPSRRSRGRHP